MTQSKQQNTKEEKNRLEIEETALLGDDGKKSKTSIPDYIHKPISKRATELNKKFTQGIIVYELLKFTYNTEHKDVIDDKEEGINERLSANGVNPNNINKIKYKRRDEARADLRDGEEEGRKQVRYWTPGDYNIFETTDNTKGDMIKTAVLENIKTPYKDRSHRIKVKRDVLRYVEAEEEPKTTVGNIVINNLDSSLIIPSEIEDIGRKTVNIEHPQDYKDNMKGVSDTGERAKAIKSLSENREVLSKEEVIKLLKATHGIGDQQAKNQVETISQIQDIWNSSPRNEEEDGDEIEHDEIKRLYNKDESKAIRYVISQKDQGHGVYMDKVKNELNEALNVDKNKIERTVYIEVDEHDGALWDFQHGKRNGGLIDNIRIKSKQVKKAK